MRRTTYDGPVPAGKALCITETQGASEVNQQFGYTILTENICKEVFVVMSKTFIKATLSTNVVT